MEYFNLRTGRCTSCRRHFDMRVLAGYDQIDPSQRDEYMTWAGARLMCCRNHFMSPHAVTLTRQEDHIVYDTANRKPVTQAQGACHLVEEPNPLDRSKEIMMLALIPEDYPVVKKKDWEVVQGAIFPNNADIPIIDKSVYSTVLLPGQNVTQGGELLTTQEYTKRTYLIW